MSDERLLLKSHLKTLKLPTMRAEYEAVAGGCNQADASYEEYLEQLVELEVQHRLAQSIERRLKQAGFPVVKEMSAYKFADVPQLNKKRVLDLAGSAINSIKNDQGLSDPAIGAQAMQQALTLYKNKVFPSVESFTVQDIKSHAQTNGHRELAIALAQRYQL